MTFWGKSIKDKGEDKNGMVTECLKDIKKNMNNLRDNELNNGNNEAGQAFDLASLSFYNSDPYFNFVHKKSERLCMAIYLITDFFPAGDSIKDNLRKSGTELLRVSLSLITASSPCRKEVLNSISRLCVEIVSLSKIASNVGMTSIPNHNVLESEVKNFIGVIEDRERPSTTGQGFVLNDETLGFDTNITTFASASSALSAGVSEKTFTNEKVSIEKRSRDEVVIENTIIAPVLSNPAKPITSVGIKTKVVERVVSEDLSDGISSVESVGVAKSVMQKNDRQQLILGIIREIGESSIKDISDNIKDCSEKTIQRELNTLIYDGVLKKVGERRWSKYILA